MDSKRIRESGKHYKNKCFVEGGIQRQIGLHRYNWEDFHKACLLPWSIVHHIDGDIHNNDPSNLYGMMRHKHYSTWNNKGIKHKFSRKKFHHKNRPKGIKYRKV